MQTDDNLPGLLRPIYPKRRNGSFMILLLINYCLHGKFSVPDLHENVSTCCLLLLLMQAMTDIEDNFSSTETVPIAIYPTHMKI